MTQDNYLEIAMRFALRLFAIPVLAMVAAVALAFVAVRFDSSPYLVGLANYVRYACGVLTIVSVGTATYNLVRVWRAYNGEDEDQCTTCGMPTSRKVGRYGPYFSCWNCGTNRADR
jgi:hypothetical protein